MRAQILGFILLFFAFGLQPLLQYARRSARTPIDPELGQLERLSPAKLSDFYTNRRTLIVGGTRGVGRGIARAIVEAGGHVTISGRSAKSGESAIAFLKNNSKSKTQQINFIAGDLGTERGAKALVRALEANAAKEGRFDYLVVTAAVFPDWNELLQEDGLEKSHAIAVVGRYTLYRHMNLYMKEGAKVLNVIASGGKSSSFNRELLTAERNATGLIETVMSFSGALEVMQIGLQESGNFHKTTRVTTNPGVLATDLHDGQGWLMDFLEPIAVALIGVSEEECGIRQANILASPRLHKERLSIVDEEMTGRTRSPELQANADKHMTWLMSWLDKRTAL